MSEEWKKVLERMKRQTKDEMRIGNLIEKELEQKYKGEKERLLNLIYSQLRQVIEIFTDENQEIYQPKIEKTSSSISLRFPIKSSSTTVHLSLDFGLILTDNGYAVTIRIEDYDFVQQRGFTHYGRIDPPVTVKMIQSTITEYLQNLTIT
jgi:hypothetical protein